MNFKTIENFNGACEQLWNNQLLSDIKYKFRNGRIIYAHSFLLSIRGQIFQKEFAKSIGTLKQIAIEDFSYEAFRMFLEYIYKSSDISFNEDNCLNMYKLAKRYGVCDLEDKSFNFILDSLNCENFCRILETALTEKWHEIVEPVLDYFSQHSKEILCHESFFGINKCTLHIILCWPFHNDSTELNIFKSVMTWAGHECQRKGLTVNEDTKRMVLGDALKFIRFPAMTIVEFMECILLEPELLTDQERETIAHHIQSKSNESLEFLKDKRFKHVESSKVLIPITNKMKMQIPDSITFNTKFSVNKAVTLTGIGYFTPEGLASVEVLTNKNRNNVKKIFHYTSEGYCTKALIPAHKIEPENQYEIIFEFTGVQSDVINGFLTCYNYPVKRVGDGDVEFRFSKICSNIKMLYYDL